MVGVGSSFFAFNLAWKYTRSDNTVPRWYMFPSHTLLETGAGMLGSSGGEFPGRQWRCVCKE